MGPFNAFRSDSILYERAGNRVQPVIFFDCLFGIMSRLLCDEARRKVLRNHCCSGKASSSMRFVFLRINKFAGANKLLPILTDFAFTNDTSCQMKSIVSVNLKVR